MSVAVNDIHLALKLQQQGRLAEAEGIYRAILRESGCGDDLNALNLLGVICAQTGRAEEARALLERAVRLAPGNPSPRYNLACVLRDTGEHRGAISHLRKAIELDPANHSARLNLARSLVETRRFAQAIDIYRDLLRIDPADPDAARSLARVLWDQGDHDEAAATLDALLLRCEDDIEAISLRGFMHLEAAEPERARERFERVAALDPGNAEHAHNAGQALVQLERVRDAIAWFERALRLEPASERYLNRLLDALEAAGETEAVLAACETVAAARPDSAVIRVRIGDALRQLGRNDDAATAYREAIALRDDLAAAWCNLAGTLCAMGRSSDAIAAARCAIERDETLTAAHTNLATAHLDRRELQSAIAAARSAIELEPDSADAHATLAAALRQAGRADDALAALLELAERNPNAADPWLRLGHMLREAGRYDEAEEAYDRALRTRPNLPDALAGRAQVALQRGSLEKARAELDAAMAMCGDHPLVAAVAAEAAMTANEPQRAVELLLPILEGAKCPARERRTLAMRLGEALDKAARYDDAFHWFTLGNELLENTYNEPATLVALKRIAQVFDAARIERLAAHGVRRARPILIAGLPRSGTTLTEQILASHDQVHGVGETGIAARAASHLGDAAGVDYPDCATVIAAEDVRAAAESMLHELAEASGPAPRTVEKSPTNALYLGLLAALLPDAKLIYCVRDLRDTCLSCYFQDFTGHYPYTYRLDHLGRYARAHEALMEHWRDVLGERLHVVEYERVVDDLEGEARRLLEFCGLPWQESCLHFHRNRRTVLTASREQVRKPIYRSSIGRWKHYEPHLKPLLAALDARTG